MQNTKHTTKKFLDFPFKVCSGFFSPFYIYSSTVIIKSVGGLEPCNHSCMVPFKQPCHLGLSPAQKRAEHVFRLPGHQGWQSNPTHKVCSWKPIRHPQDLPCLWRNLETNLPLNCFDFIFLSLCASSPHSAHVSFFSFSVTQFAFIFPSTPWSIVLLLRSEWLMATALWKG